MKVGQSRTWLLQGNPSNFDIDTYLTDFDFVYWSVPIPKYRREIRIGDKVFFWRASGKIKAVGGIVGSGVVSEKCKLQEQIDNPNLIDPGISTGEGSLWSNESSPKSDIKVGVRIHDIRLTDHIVRYLDTPESFLLGSLGRVGKILNIYLLTKWYVFNLNFW